MLNEEQKKNDDVRMAEQYFKKYKPYMKAFENSLVAKAIPVSEHHLVQLGKQFDQWEVYQQIMEANNSLNNLGELPKLALDIITATMSNTVLPVIATVQAIDDQKSLVYFKNLRADTTRGNRTAGDVIVDPLTGRSASSGYASNFNENEPSVNPTTATQVAYAYTVAAIPVYKETMKIITDIAGVFAEDVGVRGADQDLGTLLGAGLSGTIKYSTGEVNITFAADPGGAANVNTTYQQNLEEAADIPRISSFLDSKPIQAKAYALKSVVGMFQQFVLKKRLGDSALDDMTMDLTREINAEISADLIRAYVANKVGSTSFSLTIPANISEKQHRESYSFRLADANAVMVGQSGRGRIKVMLAGTEHIALVSGLDGWMPLSDGMALGSHIAGTYKGITYVEVTDSTLMGPKDGIGLFTGASPLESAGVYSPFMPLTVSQQAPLDPNPLTDQKAAATMAGTSSLVPQYATEFKVVA